MEALRFIWDAPEDDIKTKINLYKAIALNLALWGLENWARKNIDIINLKIFHHESMRRILGINMLQVKEEHIRNAQIRLEFNTINTISYMVIKRQLLYIGKIMRQPDDKIPGNIIFASIKGTIQTGRPQTTSRDAKCTSLRKLFPDIPDNGNLLFWGEFARDVITWNDLIRNLNDESKKDTSRKNFEPKNQPSHNNPPQTFPF